MEIVICSTHKFEKEFLEKANAGKHRLKFLDVRLNKTTADLANGATAVSIFVNDDASGEVLDKLKKVGVRFIVLRS
jgi:D-lactate dehydrogenase